MAEIDFNNTGKQTAFNPDLPNRETPNFTGYSRGVTGDDSLAGLFKQAGSLYGVTVETKDKINQQRIRDDATDMVDTVRNEAIGIAEGTPEGSITNNVTVPEALDKELEQTKKLTESYKNGNLKDSTYWMRMEVISKKLRSKYPAYREQIDNTMSDLTGNVPANALRSALQREAAELERGKPESPEKRLQRIEDKNFALLPDQYWIDKQMGNQWSPEKTLRTISEYGRLKMQNDIRLWDAQARNQANTDYDNAREKDSNEVFDIAKSEIQGLMTLDIRDKSDSLGLSFDALSSNLASIEAKAGQGKPITGKELLQLRSQFATYRRQLLDRRDQILSRPNEQLGGQSYNERIQMTEARRKELMAPIMTHLDNLEAAITNGEYGWLKANSAVTAQTVAEGTANLLTDPNQGWAARTAVLRDVLGPAFPVLYSSPEGQKSFSNVQEGVVAFMKSGIISTSLNLGEILEDGKQRGASNTALGVTFDDIMRTYGSDALTNPEAFRRMTKQLFADNKNFLASFPTDQRAEIFRRMLNPYVAKKMAQTTPELVKDIKDWASTSWMSLFESQAVDVRSIAELSASSTSQIKVVYDPVSMTFSASPDTLPTVRPSGRPGSPMDVSGSRAIKGPIDNLNKAVQGLVQFYKGIGVNEPNEDVLKTLSATKGLMQNVFVSSPEEKGLVQKGFDAILGALKDALPSKSSTDTARNKEKTGSATNTPVERDKLMNSPVTPEIQQFTSTGGRPSQALRSPTNQQEANVLNDYNEATVALVEAGRPGSSTEDWMRAKEAWNNARQAYNDYFGRDPGRAIGIPDSGVETLERLNDIDYTPGERRSTNIEDRRGEDNPPASSSEIRQMDQIEEILRMGEEGPYSRPGLRQSSNVEDRRR